MPEKWSGIENKTLRLETANKKKHLKTSIIRLIITIQKRKKID